MHGSKHFVIRSKNLSYDITLKSKISIIRGNAGTGKSVLVSFVQDYNMQSCMPNYDLGIQVEGYKQLAGITDTPGAALLDEIRKYEEHILFIDASCIGKTVTSHLASTLLHSNNYFVLIYRGVLDTLPVSPDSVYELLAAGTHHTLQMSIGETP